ncbi:MAG TPA: MBL fold metallo-hydrolase [Acidimicrobiales bacterium]|nr:MBL fold metallo-hydrolase [Acidimicrobiales bacterium]
MAAPPPTDSADADDHATEGRAPAPRTLTILGCDGSYAGPGGAGSGYLVEDGTTAVVLDLGPGTFSHLQQVIDPGEVDAVFLSHEHPDHWSDLESFAVWLLHHSGGRPLAVHAPPGLRKYCYFAERSVLEWHEREPSDVVPAGSLTLRFVATDHGPPTLSVRVDSQTGETPPEAPDPARAIAFSADSGFDWSVEELGSGIGTFLCEATFLRDNEGKFHHMSGRQAGTMAREAGVGRLVLTHRLPTVAADAVAAEAEEHFGRPVHQAEIGRVFEW